MVMRDKRLEVPYESPEDAQAREDRELGIPWYYIGNRRRLAREAKRYWKSQKQKAAPAAPAKSAPKPTPEKPAGPRKTPRVAPELTSPYVAPTRPGGMTQYDSGTLNPSEFVPANMSPAVSAPAAVERGTISTQGREQNYEAMFPAETFNPGVSPDSVFVPPSRRGLFGEEISQEDYDAMTRRNKEATPFYGQFLKKGGQVKKKTVKKYAKGGTVSSASKRGDGICQRGKTKGRMV